MGTMIKSSLTLLATACVMVFLTHGELSKTSPPVAMVLDYISLITEHCRSRHSMNKKEYNECFKEERKNLHYRGFQVIGICNDLVESEKTDVDLICSHLGDTIHYNFFECIVNMIRNETDSDGKEAMANSRKSIEKCMDKAFPKE